MNSMLSLQREHRNDTLAPSKIHTFSDTVPGPIFSSIFVTFWYPSGIQLDPPNQLFRYFFKHVFLYVFGRPPSSNNLEDGGQARFGIKTLSSPLSDSPPSLTPAVSLMLLHRTLACVQALSGTCTGKGPESATLRQSTF